MNSAARPALHRLSRANYGPRSIGFAVSFLVVLLLGLDRGWAIWQYLFPAFYLVIYPHLLVAASRHFSAGMRLEINAMRFDALVLGALCAWIDFFLWMSFAWFAATLLNNAVVGGIRQLLESVALFALGALAGGYVAGFESALDGPFFVEGIAMVLLLGYVLMVGFVVHGQNRDLVRNAREIEERNRIFRALVEVSASADLATDVDEFIDEALRRLQRIYPDIGLGLVVRQVDRPEVLRFAAFEGVPEDEQDSVLAYLASLPAQHDGLHTWVDMQHRATFQLLFMRARMRGNEGLIIVRASEITALLRETMGLFLESLGATIENKLMAQELKHAAETDPLTGVFNRGYLDAELAYAIRHRQQHRSMEFSVLMIDLVGLKRINDSLGHEAGDMLIQQAAMSLKALCRSTDILVRYGGDEFVILCRGISRSGADGLRRRILDEVAGRSVNLSVREGELLPTPLNMSIGVASSSETGPEKVLSLADERMYEDKRAWYQRHARHQ